MALPSLFVKASYSRPVLLLQKLSFCPKERAGQGAQESGCHQEPVDPVPSPAMPSPTSQLCEPRLLTLWLCLPHRAVLSTQWENPRSTARGVGGVGFRNSESRKNLQSWLVDCTPGSHNHLRQRCISKDYPCGPCPRTKTTITKTSPPLPPHPSES